MRTSDERAACACTTLSQFVSASAGAPADPRYDGNADIKLHTNDGKTVGVGAKVRVTGERTGADTGGPTVCAIDKVDVVGAL